MVERVLAKHKVDGSKPFTRSKKTNQHKLFSPAALMQLEEG